MLLLFVLLFLHIDVSMGRKSSPYKNFLLYVFWDELFPALPLNRTNEDLSLTSAVLLICLVQQVLHHPPEVVVSRSSHQHEFAVFTPGWRRDLRLVSQHGGDTEEDLCYTGNTNGRSEEKRSAALLR